MSTVVEMAMEGESSKACTSICPEEQASGEMSSKNSSGDETNDTRSNIESGPKEKRARPPNTPREKKQMRNGRKKRKRLRRSELRRAEMEHVRTALEHERKERHKSDCKVKVYRSMSRTYWERFRWELQKRKEAMRETMLAQRRYNSTPSARLLPTIQQIDPSMLNDVELTAVSGAASPNSAYVGRGSFGIVKLQYYRGMRVAVKEFLPRSLSDDVMREARVLSQLCHPYLPYLFGVCTRERPHRIVMQFEGILDRGVPKALTLCQELRTGASIAGLDWVIVCVQLMEAVCYLHCDVGIIHNDVKTDNILITSHSPSSQELQIILTDFGKATLLSEAKRFNLSEAEQAEYSRRYFHIAPEVIAGETKQSTSSDMFSVGGVFYRILDANKLSSIVDHQRELQQLAEKCRTVHYHRRPNARDALAFLTNLSTL